MFGERLRSAREAAKLSQAELARKIGMTRSTISQYENAGKEPSFATLVKIAQILNVTADYLVGNDEADSYGDLTAQSKIDLRDYAQLLRLRDQRDNDELNDQKIKKP